jgi:hypothetical protein
MVRTFYGLYNVTFGIVKNNIILHIHGPKEVKLPVYLIRHCGLET